MKNKYQSSSKVIDLNSRRKKPYADDAKFHNYAEGVWRKLLIMQVLVPQNEKPNHLDMMHFWYKLGLPETATANHVLDRLERRGAR